jgi:hypothetical protein
MKYFFTLTAAVASLTVSMVFSPANADEFSNSPVKRPTLFNEIYVPGGFDNNDVVQIVGEGIFRNTCFRPGPANAVLDQKNFTITLYATEYEYSGICMQMILPFERTLDVGILKDGTYKVFQNGELMDTFKVSKAGSFQPDDHLYAPITQAFFRQEGNVSKVLLSGEFSTDCLKIDRIQTAVEKKVLVIQPITSMEEREKCKPGKFPFNAVASIENIPQGRYLLHVRSMNAKAVNNIVEVRY